ncbi:hypothetical protein OH77DRAFT_1073216 [Trametes cingulata]|nr:hypothetical protein OH77DRAFT_1073216 [Trametes cingulata]
MRALPWVQTAAGLPSLNAEVYLEIYDFLEDRSTISAMMRTCHGLYDLGVARLLTKGVVIRDAVALVSFGRFMLADLAKRPRLLSSLTLLVEWVRIGGEGTSECGDYEETSNEDNEERGPSEPEDGPSFHSGVRNNSDHAENTNDNYHTTLDQDHYNDEDEDDVDRDVDDRDDDHDDAMTESHTIRTTTASEGSEDSYQERFSSLVEPEQLDGLKMLLVVLGAATRLKELRVVHCEAMLERNPDLIPAIARLPSLRLLHISPFGHRVQDVCRAIISPLVEIDVDCHLEDCRSHELCGMLDMFNAQRLTLQKITARCVDLTPYYVDLSVPTIQYPDVRSLRLIRSFSFSLEVLSRVYPGLRVLEVYATRLAKAVAPPGAARIEPNSLRSVNLEVPTPWPSLDYLCGDVKSLYILAIQCPIRSVYVHVALDTLDARRLNHVIADARPSHLGLHINYLEAKRIEDHTELGSLVDPPETFNITHLVLDMYHPSATTVEQPIIVRRRLISFFSETSLTVPQEEMSSLVARISPTFLVVRISDHLYDPDTDDDTSDSEDNVPTTVQIAILLHLASAAHSLAYVCLDLDEQPLIYYRITRITPGAPVFEQLAAGEGRALLEAEGFRWFAYPVQNPEPILPPSAFLAFLADLNLGKKEEDEEEDVEEDEEEDVEESEEEDEEEDEENA